MSRQKVVTDKMRTKYIEIATRDLNKAFNDYLDFLRLNRNKVVNERFAKVFQGGKYTEIISRVKKMLKIANDKKSRDIEAERKRNDARLIRINQTFCLEKKEAERLIESIDDEKDANLLKNCLIIYNNDSSHTENVFYNWVLDNDPIVNKFREKLREIEDSIYLSTGPEDMVALVKNINNDDFLKEIKKEMKK